MNHPTLCFLSYNRPEFLHRAIVGAIAGADRPIEVIVHDDGSTDERVVPLLRQMHVSGQISTLILNPPGHNEGVGEAVRRSFAVAAGDILMKIDQDLTFHPGWLERALGILAPIEGRIVPLRDRNGRVTGCTLVDAADYEAVAEHRWRLHNGGYAYSHIGGRTMLLHRLLLGEPKGGQVDHMNRRRLDNRRHNLRLVTPGENQQNRGEGGYGTSGHRGVSWNAKERKWYAFGKLDGKSTYLGCDDDELVAAGLARDWRKQNMPANVAEVEPPLVGMLGLFHYHHEPVNTAETIVADHGDWQEHTHFCGSAFLMRREVYEALGIATHSAAFAEDWELMKLVTDATPFVCALPREDLVVNHGFGPGPSTVVSAAPNGEIVVTRIKEEPYLVVPPSASVSGAGSETERTA